MNLEERIKEAVEGRAAILRALEVDARRWRELAKLLPSALSAPESFSSLVPLLFDTNTAQHASRIGRAIRLRQRVRVHVSGALHGPAGEHDFLARNSLDLARVARGHRNSEEQDSRDANAPYGAQREGEEAMNLEERIKEAVEGRTALLRALEVDAHRWRELAKRLPSALSAGALAQANGSDNAQRMLRGFRIEEEGDER